MFINLYKFYCLCVIFIELAIFRNHSQIQHKLSIVLKWVGNVFIINISYFSHPLDNSTQELVVKIIISHFLVIIIFLILLLIIILHYIWLLCSFLCFKWSAISSYYISILYRQFIILLRCLIYWNKDIKVLIILFKCSKNRIDCACNIHWIF